MRSEADIEAGEGVEMEFRADGRLDYCINAGDRWQIMWLTWRLEGDRLLADQTSIPREEATACALKQTGDLVLGAAGGRT